jgi:hypothetical protein
MLWLGGARVSPPQAEERQDGAPAPPAARAVPQEPVACPKCQAQMQEGSVGGPNAELVQFTWIEHPPVRQYSGWSDLLGDLFTGKLGEKVRRVDVTAFRCPSCGYIETHAR